MRCASLDQLLPPDHEARLLWAYVEQLDLALLLPDIKAVIGRPGRDANDPRVLIGLGASPEIDSLIVHWPDGNRERFPSPPLRRYTTLTQGTGTQDATK